MTNKIVILDDSVILYEHYINDEKWERTLAFPRGGLTYLISNTTIKFYAYEDYFYRNCLISMQLPIYIVDEYMHIDGEYSDVTELTEILDRIFPTNDIDAQLEKYLKIVDAELLYQPIGDYLTKASADTLYMPIGEYVTDEELVEALEDYYTKDEADDLFQPKGDYLTKASADTIYQPIGDYATNTDLDKKLDASAYTPCDFSNYYTKQEVYNKTESDNKYQVKLVAGDNITISGNVISAAGSSGGTVDAYTKAESDARYQPKGDYATESWVLNKKYITSASTVFNNYYTTANTYNKTEINNYITNLQNQINQLTSALTECCSGSTGQTIYRWITLTGDNDFLCSGTTKYEKMIKQQSTDGGSTWTSVVPEQSKYGNVLEYNSRDCGYVPQGGNKLKLTYLDNSEYTVSCDEILYECGGNLVSQITSEIVRGGSQSVKNIKYAELGDCAVSIEADAFSGCTNMQKVTLPSSYSDVPSVYCHGTDVGAFANCTSLTTIGEVGSNSSIEIPSGVTEFPSECFKSCTSLSIVDLHQNVNRLGVKMFDGCSSLGTLILRSNSVVMINPLAASSYQYDALTNTPNSLKIYVPTELVDSYKNSPTTGYYCWGKYANQIYPISQLNS